MALRLAASASALLLLPGRVSGEACPGSASPMMGTVTSLSPQCFEACPQICAPLDGLITEYMATFDTEALKAKLCADPEPFTCFFSAGHMSLCRPVLEAGSALGVELPMSTADLESTCGARQGEEPSTSGAPVVGTSHGMGWIPDPGMGLGNLPGSLAANSSTSHGMGWIPDPGMGLNFSRPSGRHYDIQQPTTTSQGLDIVSAASGRLPWTAAAMSLATAVMMRATAA